MEIPPLLTADELRTQCRVDDPAEDETLLDMAAAAERHIESLTGQVLTYRREFIRDTAFPPDGWQIVRFPVHAVVSLAYVDAADLPQTLGAGTYVLAPERTGYLLRLRRDQQWPEIAADSEITIELTAGYPAGACPRELHRACLLLAGHFYANREAVGPVQMAELPNTVAALIANHRLSFLA